MRCPPRLRRSATRACDHRASVTTSSAPGVAAATHADESYNRAAWQAQIDVLQDEVAIRGIPEGDIPELDHIAEGFNDVCVGAIDDLGRFVEQLEHTIGARQALLDREVGLDQLLEGIVQ